MIVGGCTCGYREYAKHYGHIIYMTPQTVRLSWEHSMPNPDDVISFINKYPKAIVWAIKHAPLRDKKIISKITNKKVYYSCNATNRYNELCDISLVDTIQRINKNAVLWFKGKNPNYWLPLPEKEKIYDYLLMGRRGDKNEIHFINELNKIKENRKILWIGGGAHKHKIKTHHEVKVTGFIGQNEVRNLIPTAKVGILFTEIRIEGFPQSYLEMTMCGVPVVYNIKAPLNKIYLNHNNCYLCNKKDMVETAEKLLITRNAEKCRKDAIKNYSLNKSYNWIISCLK